MRKPWSEVTEQDIEALGDVSWGVDVDDVLAQTHPADAAYYYIDALSVAEYRKDEPFVIVAGKPIAVEPEVVRDFVRKALEDWIDLLEDRYAHADCEPPDWPPGPKTEAAIEALVKAICEEYRPTVLDIVAEYETRPSEWRHLWDGDR